KPGREALEVERDGELKPVQNILRCGDAFRSALNGGTTGVAGLKGEGVGRAGDQEVDRGAPGSADRGADERPDVGAHADIRIHARVETARESGRGIPRLAKTARHSACRAVQREPSPGPVYGDLAIHALCQEVVRRCHGYSQTGPPFDAMHPPARVNLGLIARLRTAPGANEQRASGEPRSEGDLAFKAGCDCAVREIHARVSGSLADVEALQKLLLHVAVLANPGLT